jgi:hypothetical protein
MFHDVDETLRAVLVTGVPIQKNEVDIAFDRPTRDWSGRLARPALNAFLFDIREREDLKDDVPVITRDGNGRAVRSTPPKRIDLAYLLTAWTTEPDDEHRVLGRVLACMYRQDRIAPELLQGDLRHTPYPVLTRIPKPDQLIKPNDLWSSLDNDLHTPLVWVWTVPLEVFKPTVGPLVRTSEIRVGAVGAPEPDVRLLEVGGRVHRRGDALAGVAGARVSVVGTAHSAETDANGEFRFRNLPAGRYRWRVEPPGGKPRETAVVVPSASYDLEVG